MATKRSTSPQSARSLPLHLTQIAHAVRLICDARLPLHLGSKASHSHTPDDGGLRVSSVRMFPEVENDVAAYMSHFRSPLHLCIGKRASRSSPTIQPFSGHDGQRNPPPIRWPSTESDDQPYDITVLEVWCFKFTAHPSGSRAPPSQPHHMFSLGRTLSAMLRLMPLFCSNERSELLYHLAATTVPPTTTPLSLKDSYDFGGPVDTEGGKLSISVMFSRPAARAASRSSLSSATPSLASASTTPAPSAPGYVNAAARPSPNVFDGRDPKISPPVHSNRASFTPGSAPESAPISSAPRRNSLQSNQSPPVVGSLEEKIGSFGGGSRIFSPPVTVRLAGNVQPPSSSATAARAPSVPSKQYLDNMGQAAAGIASSITGASSPQFVLASSVAASSIGSPGSMPVSMSVGVDLLHAHTSRMAIQDSVVGGSVSRTSSAGSMGGRELQPLSLAWDGAGMSSAKVTSSASQAGDNPFMLADSSDEDASAGPGRLEDDDDALNDSTVRFGVPFLQLASASQPPRSMQEVMDYGKPMGKLHIQLQECEALCSHVAR